MDTPDTPDYVKIGDMSGDGVIDSEDALLMLRAAIGLDLVEPRFVVIGDVDGDGVITSADALFTLRFSLGLDTNNGIIEKVIDNNSL